MYQSHFWIANYPPKCIFYAYATYKMKGFASWKGLFTQIIFWVGKQCFQLSWNKSNILIQSKQLNLWSCLQLDFKVGNTESNSTYCILIFFFQMVKTPMQSNLKLKLLFWLLKEEELICLVILLPKIKMTVCILYFGTGKPEHLSTGRLTSVIYSVKLRNYSYSKRIL